jgi:hypothetical protein
VIRVSGAGAVRGFRPYDRGPVSLARSFYVFLSGGDITNQYNPIRITTNRINATMNSTYSELRVPPPKRVSREPAKPTIIAMEPVASTVFSI